MGSSIVDGFLPKKASYTPDFLLKPAGKAVAALRTKDKSGTRTTPKNKAGLEAALTKNAPAKKTLRKHDPDNAIMLADNTKISSDGMTKEEKFLFNNPLLGIRKDEIPRDDNKTYKKGAPEFRQRYEYSGMNPFDGVRMVEQNINPTYSIPTSDIAHKKFESFTAAAVQTSMWMLKAIDTNYDGCEHAYQIKFNEKEKQYLVGKEIRGDAGEIDPTGSIDKPEYYNSTDPNKSIPEEFYAGGHTHPLKPGLSTSTWHGPGFSPEDFRFLRRTKPILGYRNHALLDATTKRILIVSMKEGLEPPFYNGEWLVSRSDEMKKFITNNRENGNLKLNIYAIDNNGASLCNEKCANSDGTYFQDYYSFMGIGPSASSDWARGIGIGFENY